MSVELFEWLEQLARDASLVRFSAFHDRITGDVLTVGDVP